jgi:uncharacterized protein YndB with AHSA1/START domain
LRVFEEVGMDDERAVEREITLPVPPDEAWELVTDREHLQRWLAPEVDIDVRRGGDVRIVEDDGEERTGTVELVDAPNRLRFVWETARDDLTVVEITVSPDEGGSRIAITEREPFLVEAVAGTVVPLVRRPAGPLALAA